MIHAKFWLAVLYPRSRYNNKSGFYNFSSSVNHKN